MGRDGSGTSRMGLGPPLLTWAWGQGGRGPVASLPLPQAALQVPQLLLFLLHRLLPLPARLAAQVPLPAQAPRGLGNLQLQGQLPLQAAQWVLGEDAVSDTGTAQTPSRRRRPGPRTHPAA